MPNKETLFKESQMVICHILDVILVNLSKGGTFGLLCISQDYALAYRLTTWST